MTMKMKETEQLLSKFTSSLMASIGFKKIDADFYGRPEHDAIARISFPLRLSVCGTGLFTIGVGLE